VYFSLLLLKKNIILSIIFLLSKPPKNKKILINFFFIIDFLLFKKDGHIKYLKPIFFIFLSTLCNREFIYSASLCSYFIASRKIIFLKFFLIFFKYLVFLVRYLSIINKLDLNFFIALYSSLFVAFVLMD